MEQRLISDAVGRLLATAGIGDVVRELVNQIHEQVRVGKGDHNVSIPTDWRGKDEKKKKKDGKNPDEENDDEPKTGDTNEKKKFKKQSGDSSKKEGTIPPIGAKTPPKTAPDKPPPKTAPGKPETPKPSPGAGPKPQPGGVKEGEEPEKVARDDLEIKCTINGRPSKIELKMGDKYRLRDEGGKTRLIRGPEFNRMGKVYIDQSDVSKLR